MPPGPVDMPRQVPKHLEDFRRLREEQDREYEASLAIDRAKVCLPSSIIDTHIILLFVGSIL